MMATLCGHGDVIRKLLQAGADLYIRNKVELICLYCRSDLTRVVYPTTQDGETAIDFTESAATKRMMFKFGTRVTVQHFQNPGKLPRNLHPC
jgi:ankyrin repeat protein